MDPMREEGEGIGDGGGAEFVLWVEEDAGTAKLHGVGEHLVEVGVAGSLGAILIQGRSDFVLGVQDEQWAPCGGVTNKNVGA